MRPVCLFSFFFPLCDGNTIKADFTHPTLDNIARDYRLKDVDAERWILCPFCYVCACVCVCVFVFPLSDGNKRARQ